MKKLSVILIALSLLLAIVLCGCSSFAWSDDGEVNSISKIEKIIDSEGNVVIEIHYTNSDRIDRFPLPEGNGIANIEYEDDDAKKVTVVTITYTSGNVTTINIPYGKDGTDGFSIDEVVLDQNLNGEPVLVFYYTDSNGTKMERGRVNIKDLKGKDGLGFKSFEYFEDEIGTGVRISMTGETEPTTYYFTYKRFISVEIIGDEYVITITTGNPENGNVDIFRLTRMPTWLQGPSYPSQSLGIAGDFYFDTYHQAIFTKIGDDDEDLSSGNWVLVCELNTQKNSFFKVTFNAGKGRIPGYDQYKINDESSNIYELGEIPYNSYFYDKYGAIPVPEQEGFRFVGWYRSLSPTIGEASFNDFVLITSDITLIARWEKI